jgi:hypothetical protein
MSRRCPQPKSRRRCSSRRRRCSFRGDRKSDRQAARCGGDSAGDRLLTDIISILSGAVVFAMPETGALVLLALIAPFALIGSISEIVVTIGGEKLIERDLKAMFAPRPQRLATSDVGGYAEDAR